MLNLIGVYANQNKGCIGKFVSRFENECLGCRIFISIYEGVGGSKLQSGWFNCMLFGLVSFCRECRLMGAADKCGCQDS